GCRRTMKFLPSLAERSMVQRSLNASEPLSAQDTVSGAAAALPSALAACSCSPFTEQPASSSATSARECRKAKLSAPLDLADVAHRPARGPGGDRGIGAQGGADFALAQGRLPGLGALRLHR